MGRSTHLIQHSRYKLSGRVQIRTNHMLKLIQEAESRLTHCFCCKLSVEESKLHEMGFTRQAK